MGAGVRRLTANKAGVAALRHDPDFVRVTKGEKRGDFFGRFRLNQTQGAAMILAARFGHIRAQIRRIFYYSRPSDNRR
jgi:hypothetical protein